MNKKNWIVIIICGCITFLFIIALLIVLVLNVIKANDNNKDNNTIENGKNETEEGLHTINDLKKKYSVSIDQIDKMDTSWKMIQTKEEMNQFVEWLATSTNSITFKSKDIANATDDEITHFIEEYIIRKYWNEKQSYPSIICSKKEDFYAIAENILDKKDIKPSKEKINILDEYFCNFPGTGSSGFSNGKYTLTNKSESTENDITTIIFNYDYIVENEVNSKHTIEIKMKKVDDLYKLIYYSKSY